MGLFSADEPATYKILEQTFKCHTCKNDTFWKQEAQLNTAVASFFNLDWANKSATCLVCSNCAYIHWFLL